MRRLIQVKSSTLNWNFAKNTNLISRTHSLPFVYEVACRLWNTECKIKCLIIYNEAAKQPTPHFPKQLKRSKFEYSHLFAQKSAPDIVPRHKWLGKRLPWSALPPTIRALPGLLQILQPFPASSSTSVCQDANYFDFKSQNEFRNQIWGKFKARCPSPSYIYHRWNPNLKRLCLWVRRGKCNKLTALESFMEI